MSENKQQTAVEFLINIAGNHISVSDMSIARRLMKKQIEDSFDMGVSSVIKNFNKSYSEIDGQEYYTQTYGE